MLLKHIVGLLKSPAAEWQNIRKENCSVGKCYCSHVLLLAAMPPVAFYFGTTEVGWSVGSSSNVEKFTHDIGLIYGLLLYCAILMGIFLMGVATNWMSSTYDVTPNLSRAIGLSAYAATPLLLTGIMLLYPVLWVLLLISLVALGYTVYLLYLGLPIMLDIPKEKGFLYSSAILAFGLIMLVGMLVAMILFWEYGFAPTYTS